MCRRLPSPAKKKTSPRGLEPRGFSKTSLLSAEEERLLAREARAGNRDAYHQLVQANLPLVVRIASRYAHPNVPLADLIQEGNLGLLKAVERFDPERGYRFSTYAVWWIRRAILRSLVYDSRLIRLPEHVCALAARTARVVNELRRQGGREPTFEEIADALRAKPELVALAVQGGHELVSLDADPLPRETLEDPQQNPARSWERWGLSEEAERLLNALPSRERAILRARFGMDTGQPLTLQETGKLFSLTRERIRQIERRALEVLRRLGARVRPVASSP